MNNLLPIREAADVCGVSIDTLRKWEQRGWLFPQYTQGGHRRYTQVQIEMLKEVETNPMTYRIQFDTWRMLPQGLKIIATIANADFDLEKDSIWRDGDPSPTKPASLGELGVYHKMTGSIPIPIHRWEREVMLEDENRESPLWISNHNGKFVKHQVKNDDGEDCDVSDPRAWLYLSTFDIWRDDYRAWMDNRKTMAPEFIWGEELKSHTKELTEGSLDMLPEDKLIQTVKMWFLHDSGEKFEESHCFDVYQSWDDSDGSKMALQQAEKVVKVRLRLLPESVQLVKIKVKGRPVKHEMRRGTLTNTRFFSRCWLVLHDVPSGLQIRLKGASSGLVETKTDTNGRSSNVLTIQGQNILREYSRVLRECHVVKKYLGKDAMINELNFYGKISRKKMSKKQPKIKSRKQARQLLGVKEGDKFWGELKNK